MSNGSASWAQLAAAAPLDIAAHGAISNPILAVDVDNGSCDDRIAARAERRSMTRSTPVRAVAHTVLSEIVVRVECEGIVLAVQLHALDVRMRPIVATRREERASISCAKLHEIAAASAVAACRRRDQTPRPCLEKQRNTV